MARSAPVQARRAGAALGLAAVAHLASFAVLDHIGWRPRIPLPPLFVPPPPPAPLAVAIAADIAFLDVAVPSLTVEAVLGPGDAVGIANTHPLPGASADLPGKVAAERGGGAVGGAATWTGRRDPSDDAALRAEVWTGGVDYRTAHRDTGRAPRAPEALKRSPDRDYGDRASAPKASAGAVAASIGDAAAGTGGGHGELPSWRDADPLFDLPAGRTTPARTEGTPRPTRSDALATVGETSDDVLRRGKAGDDRSVTAASDQRNPDPFDWTPARSGGTTGEGVAGRTGRGVLRDGRGRGDAATRARVGVGAADLSITADRQDPYFRELYRQLDRLVEFPRELAIGLQSGWLIGVMTVDPAGAISGITIERSSGQAGFDSSLDRAMRRVSLGPVPVRLLDGHRALRVRIPYTFRNPLVR
jgi:TonB family protein